MIAYKLVVRSCYTCPDRGVQRPRCLEFLIKYVNVGYEPSHSPAPAPAPHTAARRDSAQFLCSGLLSPLRPTQASAAQRDEYSISSIYTHLAARQLQPRTLSWWQLMASWWLLAAANMFVFSRAASGGCSPQLGAGAASPQVASGGPVKQFRWWRARNTPATSQLNWVVTIRDTVASGNKTIYPEPRGRVSPASSGTIFHSFIISPSPWRLILFFIRAHTSPSKIYDHLGEFWRQKIWISSELVSGWCVAGVV